MRYCSNNLLADTIKLGSYEDLSPIFEQLGIIQSETYPSKFLAKKIVEQGGNAITNIFRDGEATGYLDVLNQISSSLGLENIELSQPEVLKLDDTHSVLISSVNITQIKQAIERLENAIIENISQKIQASFTSEQKAAFQRELSAKLGDFNDATKAKILGAGGALTLGNLGGFATYTTVSSLLHFVSAGLLGFGAYTATASLVSIALGPVGWGSLGIYALFKSSSPKLKKLLPIVLSISMIRNRAQA